MCDYVVVRVLHNNTYLLFQQPLAGKKCDDNNNVCKRRFEQRTVEVIRDFESTFVSLSLKRFFAQINLFSDLENWLDMKKEQT